MAKKLSFAGARLAKIALGGVVLIGLGAATMAYSKTNEPMHSRKSRIHLSVSIYSRLA